MKSIKVWSITFVAVGAISAAGLSAAHADPPGQKAPPPLPSSARAKVGNDEGVAGRAAATVLAADKTENRFVRITPCTIADTRKSGAGGKLAKSGKRSFYVRGTSGFAGQGGTSGGCGLPLSATAVATSVSVYDAKHSGTMSGGPYNGTARARFVQYQKSQTTVVNPTFALTEFGFAPHLTIANSSGSSVNLAIQVVGYYQPQIAGIMNSGDGVYYGTTRILSNDNTATGQYTVTLDRDVTGCTVQASPYSGPYLVTAYTSGNTVRATAYYFNGGVPTLANMYWQLDVSC